MTGCKGTDCRIKGCYTIMEVRKQKGDIVQAKVWTDIIKGTRLLFTDKGIRFALLIELVSAIAGAQILVNTVGYIKGQLHLTDKHYGYVMAAFGIGAAIAAFASGNFDKSKNRIASLMIGGGLVCASIAFGNYVVFIPLLILWLIAGFGQTLAEMPSQILIATKNICLAPNHAATPPAKPGPRTARSWFVAFDNAIPEL